MKETSTGAEVGLTTFNVNVKAGNADAGKSFGFKVEYPYTSNPTASSLLAFLCPSSSFPAAAASAVVIVLCDDPRSNSSSSTRSRVNGYMPEKVNPSTPFPSAFAGGWVRNTLVVVPTFAAIQKSSTYLPCCELYSDNH
jgi:hypothetical protein